MILGKALTWDELAKEFDECHMTGRQARTLPMDGIFAWAKKQTDKFFVSEEGTIHKIRALEVKR